MWKRELVPFNFRLLLIQMKPKDWMKKVFLTNASVVSENTPTEKDETCLSAGLWYLFCFCKLCYYVLLHFIDFISQV